MYYKDFGYKTVESFILNATKKQKISVLRSMYQECYLQISIKRPNNDVKKKDLHHFISGNIGKHIHELKLIYLSLSDKEKPTWLSLEKIKFCLAALMPNPRCDFCTHCYDASHRCYCDISGKDVAQSEFGGNSPKNCPLRKNWQTPFYIEQNLE